VGNKQADRNESEPICSLVSHKIRKASLSGKGEASNLSEETDKSKIDFLRGIRGGMLGKVAKGTWESL